MSLDTDLQCDFNNPFWEEVECAWSFKPSEGLVTSPLRRMEWVKNKDFKSSNYWLDKNSLTGRNYLRYSNAEFHIDHYIHWSLFLDNHYLAGYHPGDYMLLSEWQKEKDPRIFDSHFGFEFKAINTQVKVTIHKKGDTNPEDLLDKFYAKIEHNDVDDGWHYFLKNLTEVNMLKTNWDSGTAIEWRVSQEPELMLQVQGFMIQNTFCCFRL